MMNKLLASLVVVGLALATCSAFVVAFHAGIASAQAPDAGSAVQPSDKVHDPVSAPQQTFDDLKAAKKTGWGIFVLTCALVACRVLAKLGGVFSKLRQGKVALAVAAFTALSMTAFNAVALGGSWVAALAAGVTAAFAAWDAKHPQTAEQTTTGSPPA